MTGAGEGHRTKRGVHFSAEEWALVERAARKAGMAVATYVRQAALAAANRLGA